jgi:ribosomal protein S18 acetylase RimI-like enzyme
MADKNYKTINGIELRPVVMPDDEIFLRDLYFSTRDDLNLLPLDESQKQALIGMQYAAQKQQYDVQHPRAEHDLIMRDGLPVGRLLVDRAPDLVYLIDISLLPASRGRGVGTAIMNALADEAGNAGADFGLHVLKTNPAARLYFRAGLTVTGDDGLYLEMRKLPKG